MKTCKYCGRENEELATRCRQCGRKFPRDQAPGQHTSKQPGLEERFERIAVLENEVQAGLVDGVLADREIPHIMQSYHDSAYDGLFQAQKGWGVLLAPASFRNEILAALEDIKRQSQSRLDESEGEKT